MAQIEVLLYTRLVGDAAVAALVGNRVYPRALPQLATLPALRYTLVDRVEVLVKPLQPSLRVMRGRVQVDCYAQTYAAAKALAAAVKTLLYNWCDPDAGVIGVRVANESDLSGLDETVQRISLDALITYNE